MIRNVVGGHRPIIFKYCYEIDKVPQREESHVLKVNHSSSSHGASTFIFLRESILEALEDDGIDTSTLLPLKYFDSPLMGWDEVPETLTIKAEGKLYSIGQPLIVDLLIRECSQKLLHSRRNSSLQKSNSHNVQKDSQNYQELERQFLKLQERVSDLEKRCDKNEKNLAIDHLIHEPPPQSFHDSNNGSQSDVNEARESQRSRHHKFSQENKHDSTSLISNSDYIEQESYFSSEQIESLSRITSDQHLGSNDLMNSPIGHIYKSQKKKLDLAFLFADPLVSKNKKQQLVAFNQPLDTEKEFREIQKIIQSSKKAFTMRKEALNFETLQQILMKQPTMIHISCHGDYDKESKQFYLAFEQKDTGILDKFTEDRCRKLLGEEGNHKVHLVFVSACHSQLIGQIFIRAKVPVVVAVNSQSLILDDVCQLFARHFYNQLLEGYSPKVAFQEAQRVVQGSDIDKYSCCCAHDHKPNCKWQKYAMKYGYEKAHQIHKPDCYCQGELNEHKTLCKFYLEFQNHLKDFQSDNEEKFNDEDLENLPSVNGTIKFCCCQPNLPHDESIKFILNGDEDAQNKALFRNRQDGQIVLEADVNQNNKLPQVLDTQMLVGRSIELQKIIETLFKEVSSKRLIHLYGQEGVGKSSIANYAAKYTLERRKFPDGVYSVEVQNKTSGKGLLQKICQKLQLQNLSKEQLCDFINSNHILIVVDKCRSIIEFGQSSFNKKLKYLIENTRFVKIIVITLNELDIANESYLIQFPINVLSNFNAAQLLINVACDAKYLKRQQNANTLAQHKIFQLIPNKPQGIIQIASLLNTKSLDEIVQEKESEIKRMEDGRQKQEQIKQMEYGEFSWILGISYRKLEAKFHTELNLLYLLCQAPGGLTEQDIEYICTENGQLYGDWKTFLQKIVRNEDQEPPCNKNSTDRLKKQSSLSLEEFQIVTSNYDEELNGYHYISQPIVTEYINTLVLNESKKAFAFQEYIRYMSLLSKRQLKSLIIQKSKEYDISLVNSDIDIGIWSDQHEVDRLSQQMITNAEVMFNYSETNFCGIIDLELLKRYVPQSVDANNVILRYFDELLNNLPSILILLNRYDEAQIMLQKARKICDYYQLKSHKAKIYLQESSIQLKLNRNLKNVMLQLEQAEKLFNDLNQYEGAGDARFLMALTLIKSINSKLLSYPEQDMTLNQKFEQIPMEKSVSDNQIFDQFKAKSLTFISPQNSINLSHQQSANQLTREADGVLQSLQWAKHYFKKANNEFGLAKSNIIEAEFQIDNCYGSGLNVQFEPQKLVQSLQDSIIVYKKIGCDNLVARCLRNLADVMYQIDEYYEAKNHIMNALIIIKRIQDNHQEALASSILNKILHKIRIKANNVFMFTKAFPFIEVIGSSEKIVGTYTRYTNDFRKRLHDEFKKENKVINLKFDQLDRKSLDYIKTYGCRVLHLSSDVYIQDSLCIENANGEIEYISIDELKQTLKPQVGKLNVDVVVVAIPESFKLAQVFVELGVPHVIGFDFKQTLLSTFMDNIYTLPKQYDYIYDFCVEFYKNLLQEMTVIQAWKLAKPRLNDGIKRMNEKITNSNLTKKDVGEGPALFPRNGKHNVKLFDNVSGGYPMQLQTGHFLDSSRVRGPFSVKRINAPYTGRQFEMHKVMTNLRKGNVRMINVVGLEGIGKTRFLSETAYYMHARYHYQDGIFMLNLNRMKTTEEIKQKLKEVNIGNGQNLDLNTNLQNKNLLLILDNVDYLMKYNKTQFGWWLMSLLQQGENIKLILSSKTNIKLDECAKLQSETRFVKLKPLNDIEAVDMILTNCNRHITPDELQMSNDSRRNIHLQLQQEISVKNCYGYPKYLEIFAQILEIHRFDKIDIQSKITNSKRGQMRRLQIEQEDPLIGNQNSKRRLKNGNDKKVYPCDVHTRIDQKMNTRGNKAKENLNEAKKNKSSFNEKDIIQEVDEDIIDQVPISKRKRLPTQEEEKLGVMELTGIKECESIGNEADSSRKLSGFMEKTDHSSDNDELGVKIQTWSNNRLKSDLYKSLGSRPNIMSKGTLLNFDYDDCQNNSASKLGAVLANIEKQQQIYGRMSVDDRNFQNFENTLKDYCEEDQQKILITIMKPIQREDSVMSQTYDQQSEFGRSRSESEILFENQFNLRQTRSDEVSIPFQQQRTQNVKHGDKDSDSKGCSVEGQLKRPEKVAIGQLDTKFDFEQAKSAHSEIVDQSDQFDDEDFVDELGLGLQSDFEVCQTQKWDSTGVQEKKLERKKSKRLLKQERRKGQLEKQRSSGHLILLQSSSSDEEEAKKDVKKSNESIRKSGSKS